MRKVFLIIILAFVLPAAYADEYRFDMKKATVSSDAGEIGKASGGGMPDAGDAYSWKLEGISKGIYRVKFHVRTGSADPGTGYVSEYRMTVSERAFPRGIDPYELGFTLDPSLPLRTTTVKPTYKVIKGRIQAESLLCLKPGDVITLKCRRTWASVSELILAEPTTEELFDVKVFTDRPTNVFALDENKRLKMHLINFRDKPQTIDVQIKAFEKKSKKEISHKTLVTVLKQCGVLLEMDLELNEPGTYEVEILFFREDAKVGTKKVIFGVTPVRQKRFPFVISGDDSSKTVTDMSWLNHKPAGKFGFVRIKDGKFHTDNGRVRFWGNNVCFSGNFPTHEQAEKVAAHMAKLGMNVVRFHHHDCNDAPSGIWKKGLVDGRRVFNPEMLDRQDYFLNELHKNGIYANLNLHVSRTFMEAEGFLNKNGLARAFRYDKYLLYYMPNMRVLFREFLKSYLLHMNPYRKMRRIDDPGIAMLEITNENSFSTRGAGLAASLPDPYRSEFKKQWNEWLVKKYKTTDALKEAWAEKGEPLQGVIADFGNIGEKQQPWIINQQKECPVKLVHGLAGPKQDIKAVKLDIIKPAGASWHQELLRAGLSVEKGKLYTLSFWIKADSPRNVYADVSKSSNNWRNIGYRETISVLKEWQQIIRTFRAKEALTNDVRICFKFGGSNIDLYFADIKLQKGGDLGLFLKGSSLEENNIDIPIAGWVEAAQNDARRFMIDTEKDFINEIMDYLKNDLGAKVPITASQISYHGAEIVAETCDYADIHSYWQHPRFPVKPWDAKNWFVNNTPMAQAPGKDALTGRASWRLLDRPYTISEWNIAAPSDYAASVVPFAAVIGGLQDWDGIFFFCYGGGGNSWFTSKLHGYFGFNGHPVKLALHTALARCYRQGDIPVLEKEIAGTLGSHINPSAALGARIGISPDADTPAPYNGSDSKKLETPDRSVIWNAEDKNKAYVSLNTPSTRGVWGLVAGEKFQLGDTGFEIGKTEWDYAAIILTSLDGKEIVKAKKLLLVAAGTAENLDMGWNPERNSVSNKWGKGPTQINVIPVKLSFPFIAKEMYALDGTGKRMEQVKLEHPGIGTKAEIGEEYKTLWYEIVAK